MRRQTYKILLPWLLIAGGSFFLVSGVRELFTSRVAQRQAAASWSAGHPASKDDGQILPRGDKSRSLIPQGESFARLSIPRLHAVLYVFEGTDDWDLRRGPGHLEGSALPGPSGNCVIAGHRDTHFRVLEDVQKGDEIQIETAAGNFIYRVSDIAVVAPSNTAALQPTGHPVLSLVTCYPFGYVGSAPKRFVVRAGLIATRASHQDFAPGS